MFEEKDAFAPVGDINTKRNYYQPMMLLRQADIIDLTNKLNADGTLNWTAPAGDWNSCSFWLFIDWVSTIIPHLLKQQVWK